jgi:hypothetical protein
MCINTTIWSICIFGSIASTCLSNCSHMISRTKSNMKNYGFYHVPYEDMCTLGMCTLDMCILDMYIVDISIHD